MFELHAAGEYEAARTQVDRPVSGVTSQLSRTSGQIILGGRPLDAEVALHLATAGIVSASGLILVAPTIRWDSNESHDPVPTVIQSAIAG